MEEELNSIKHSMGTDAEKAKQRADLLEDKLAKERQEIEKERERAKAEQERDKAEQVRERESAKEELERAKQKLEQGKGGDKDSKACVIS